MPLKDLEARRAYDISRNKSRQNEECRKKEREKQRVFRAANPERVRATSKRSRIKNAEKIRRDKKEYAIANKEKIQAKQAVYRSTRREEAKAKSAAWRAEHPGDAYAAVRAWNKANPEKKLEYGKKRRATKNSAPRNDLTLTEWQLLKEVFGYRCAYCKKKPKSLTQDHITPLSRGGSHTLSNIVPACRSCNARKNAGPPLVPVQPLLL